MSGGSADNFAAFTFTVGSGEECSSSEVGIRNVTVTPSTVSPGGTLTVRFEYSGTGPTYPYEYRWVSQTEGGEAITFHVGNVEACLWYTDEFTLTAPSAAGTYTWYVAGYGSSNSTGMSGGSADNFAAFTFQVSAASIKISEILGGRTATIGSFDQENNADSPMRLFVDTTEVWDGGALLPGQYDRQRVRIKVLITPSTLNMANLRVRWELRDPDDPATHADVDNSNNGGDNTGKLHEAGTYWFTKSDHNMAGQANLPAVNENTVIGEANTVITNVNGQNISTAFFNFSDDGGDNFVVRVILVDTKGTETTTDDVSYGYDDSDTLTVWRKRFVHVYAMARHTDDVQIIDPGQGGPNQTCISAGRNGKIDISPLGDDRVVGNTITTGANGICETNASSWYPGSHLANIQDILRTTFARGAATGFDANRSTYIDIVAENRTRTMTYDSGIEVGPPAKDFEEWIDYLKAEAAGGVALQNTYRIIGVRQFTTNDLGDTCHFPNCGVAVEDLPTLGGLNSTAMHELGHALLPYDNQPGQNVDIHNNHTAGTACAGKTANQDEGLLWCPRHARIIRRNVTRAFNALPANGAPTTSTTEATRDSD